MKSIAWRRCPDEMIIRGNFENNGYTMLGVNIRDQFVPTKEQLLWFSWSRCIELRNEAHQSFVIIYAVVSCWTFTNSNPHSHIKIYLYVVTWLVFLVHRLLTEGGKHFRQDIKTHDVIADVWRHHVTWGDSRWRTVTADVLSRPHWSRHFLFHLAQGCHVQSELENIWEKWLIDQDRWGVNEVDTDVWATVIDQGEI